MLPSAITQLPELTDREKEVLVALARGQSNVEIAGSLNLSLGTIKSHLSAIMAKWDARDRVQVLVLAARTGLVRFR
ncbi:response regulator transcription factor [Microbacterium sp.]|uniref:response regulator transcription factor n=1 Tax=Microbacterium sp. TaxID=51671 RepID=UPI003A8A666C